MIGDRIVSFAVILIMFLNFGCGSRGRFSASLDRAKKYDLEIIRDQWGVPHIFGKTDPDVAFGLAYANAEDDFPTIQNLLIASRGKLAAALGKEMAANDYMVQLLRIWETVDQKYETLSPEIREICEAYADGLNCYASQNRDLLIYDKIFPVSGKDLVAGFLHKLPLFYGLDGTLKRIFDNKISPSPKKIGSANFDQKMIGSNFFAVGPSRSADGSTLVAINSHQPWEGPVAWYEAHLISENGLDVYGGLFPGSPVVFLGHNRKIAWGHTVNDPDLIDVFELEINPKNRNEYKFDGEWRKLEIKKAPIEVKLWKSIRWTFKREILWCVYGPALRNDKGVFAIRYAGMGDVRAIEQWHKMNKAENLDQFKKAMKIHAIPMFNTCYADHHGSLYFVYNALLPQRDPNYDWSGTVIGDRSETLWKNYLPFDQLPQVENPPSAFIQSCNSSPFKTTIGEGNPDPKQFPNYFRIETFLTNRSRRVRELFGENGKVTRDQFFAYKFDKRYSEKSKLIQIIDRFLKEVKTDEPDQIFALELIRKWDRNTDLENRSTAIVTLTFRPRSQTGRLRYDKDRFLRHMIEAIETLKKNHGRIDVAWGEVNRLVRGEIDLPLAGGHDVLRAIYGDFNDDGRIIGRAGDCFFQIVEWARNGDQKVWVINQYGSHPWRKDSPHYADQAPLFAREEMRSALLTKTEIIENAERRYNPLSKSK